MKAISWILIMVGLATTALPLYAEIFTKEETPVGTIEHESEYSVSTMVTTEITMMHVPSFVPAIGGIVTLVGGIMMGRSANGTEKRGMTE